MPFLLFYYYVLIPLHPRSNLALLPKYKSSIVFYRNLLPNLLPNLVASHNQLQVQTPSHDPVCSGPRLASPSQQVGPGPHLIHCFCTCFSLWLKRSSDFPGGTNGKESTNHPANQETQFDPWVWKLPWRRKWQLTPVFLPGKFHGQMNPAGYSPWGLKESDTTEHTCHTHTLWSERPVKWSESLSAVSDSSQPHRLYSPWNSPCQNTGLGSLTLLQQIFLTQNRNGISRIASWTTREALTPPEYSGFSSNFTFWEYCVSPLLSATEIILHN